MGLAVPRGCCTGQRVAVEGYVTLASLPAQLCSIWKVGGREGCGSPGSHLIWSQHVGQGRCLDVHSALLIRMYNMTYPKNPEKAFPLDVWLRALTHGLKQAIVWSEHVDVDDIDGGGSLPSAARAGLRGLPRQLSPPPSPHVCVQWLSL